MSLLRARVRFIAPGRLLQLYLAVVIATAAAAVIVVLSMSTRMDARSRETAEHWEAAVAVSRIQVALDQPQAILNDTLVAFFASDAFTALASDEQAALYNSLAVSPSTPPPGTPKLPLRFSDRDAVRFSRLIDFISGEIDKVVASIGPPGGAVTGAERQLLIAVEAYYDEPSTYTLGPVIAGVRSLDGAFDNAATFLIDDARFDQASLLDAIAQSKTVSLAALLSIVLTLGVATFLVGRIIHRAYATANAEKEALRGTTETLQYRNNQLNALYNVFAEITDTLSLRYVVRATVREAMSLMNANMAVLRLLKGSELVVVGNLTDNRGEIEGIAPVPLGEGPTGRAARRGRTLRIDHSAQDQLGPSVEPGSSVESGVIAPLIVGARVVGTLAVWSREANAFSTDDERVLEMMASQVATAVIAADTTDSSMQRAHQDALTGLPNRLQLSEDLTGELLTLASSGRNAVVAMADIDHFKGFNDDYGHKVGDVTLQQVGAVLRHAVRDNDRVYRYGGEEFVLIFTDAGPGEACALAERVRAAIEATPFSGDQMEPVGPVTISIGLALMPEHGTDVMALIELADKAMYQAKDAGRNRVVLWQGEPASPSLVA
jgi:diguanylate cyclase (GGDEF)-like protein